MDRARRRPRHRALAVALATLLVPLVVGSTAAAPPGQRPAVAVAATVTGANVSVTADVNRVLGDLASCTYVLDTNAAASCGAPAFNAKKVSTYTIGLSGQAVGPHTITVTVVLKDGGSGSGLANFTIAAPPVGGDLQISIDDGLTAVGPGQTVRWSVGFFNAGPTTATNVIVTVTLPSATTYVNSGPDWNCLGNVCTFAMGELTESDPFIIIPIEATVVSPIPAGLTSIIATATIVDDDSHGPDPSPSNDNASDTDTIVAPPRAVCPEGTDNAGQEIPEGETAETFCNEEPPRVFAIAWTNRDGVAGYQPGDTDTSDVLIAKLEDANRSNEIDADDTITTDQFPLDFAATIFADATVTSFVVTDVNPGDATTISVNSGEARFRWLSNPDFDRYDEQLDSLVNGFVDRSGPESCASVGDVLGVLAGSPSQPFPTNPSPIVQCDELDNAFLDVTFS